MPLFAKSHDPGELTDRLHDAETVTAELLSDVIGETCRIGARVRLYQGVTLGARGFSTDPHGFLVKGLPRHPIIGDDVVIYAGATILGRVTVGEGAEIGGNVWLTRDVPANARVTQARVQHNVVEEGAGS